jgi:hypothetical protein
VARDLKNCAASYVKQVVRKDIVFIALTLNSAAGHEKPFALADYRIGRQGGDGDSRGWGQMVKSCNANASPETCAHFHAIGWDSGGV